MSLHIKHSGKKSDVHIKLEELRVFRVQDQALCLSWARESGGLRVHPDHIRSYRLEPQHSSNVLEIVLDLPARQADLVPS